SVACASRPTRRVCSTPRSGPSSTCSQPASWSADSSTTTTREVPGSPPGRYSGVSPARLRARWRREPDREKAPGKSGHRLMICARQGRDVDLWLLCLWTAFVFGTKEMLTPLVPLYSLQLGASVSMVGFLVAIAYVLPLFLAMPVGTLVDRRGSRTIMLMGAGLMALAPVSIAVIPGLVAVGIGQVIAGLAHLLVGLATQSLVGSLSTGVRRERDFGWYTTFASAGQLVGPLAAGLLVDGYGYVTAFAAG